MLSLTINIKPMRNTMKGNIMTNQKPKKENGPMMTSDDTLYRTYS
jgi:hypothetical protein